MGLLRSIVSLPIRGPIDSVSWVAGKIHEAAERDFNSPAAIRKALQALEQDLLSGAITEDAYDSAETALLLRLKGAK